MAIVIVAIVFAMLYSARFHKRLATVDLSSNECLQLLDSTAAFNIVAELICKRVVSIKYRT